MKDGFSTGTARTGEEEHGSPAGEGYKNPESRSGWRPCEFERGRSFQLLHDSRNKDDNPRDTESGLDSRMTKRGGIKEKSCRTLQCLVIDSFDAMAMPTYGRMHTSNRYHIFSNYPVPAS